MFRPPESRICRRASDASFKGCRLSLRGRARLARMIFPELLMGAPICRVRVR